MLLDHASFRTSRIGAPTSRRRVSADGKTMVLYALILTAMLGLAGLLLDSGRAWVGDREAENAADVAALAAAKAVSDAGQTCDATGRATAVAAATSVAGANGFATVTVNYPPTVTSNGGFQDCSHVEVLVARPLDLTFSRILGQTQWTNRARAVARIATVASGTGECRICALAPTGDATLDVHHNGAIDIDGSIHVNSNNSSKSLSNKIVYGNALLIGGWGWVDANLRVQAETIRVRGGWKRDDDGAIVLAKRLANSSDFPKSTCADTPANHPDPKDYDRVTGGKSANVCINEPELPDPLAKLPVPDAKKFPVRATTKLTFSSGTHTLQPGVYVGGIEIKDKATVNMESGVYILQAGAGFVVASSDASLYAPSVFIYADGDQGGVERITIDNPRGSVVLGPLTTGPWAGITAWVDRKSDDPIKLYLSLNPECAQPKGCLGRVSGTFYAAHNASQIRLDGSGTTDLRLIAGKIRIASINAMRLSNSSGGTTTTRVMLVE